MFEIGGTVGFVMSFKPERFKDGVQIDCSFGPKGTGDEEVHIDGLEREDFYAQVFLVHMEAPAPDKFDTVLPESSPIEGGQEVFNDVVLHWIFPSGDD